MAKEKGEKKKRAVNTGRRRKAILPPDPPSPDGDPDDPANRPLSADEIRFVEEFLIDRNASRAYRTCYPNCSHWRAGRGGHEMRYRPHVEREIRAAVRAQSIRTQVTADRALKEIARVAFSDILDLYCPETGRLYAPRNIPLEARRAIASIKVGRERRTERTSGRTQTTVVDTVISYTLWPKLEALGKICRHLGLDTEITPLEALLQALPRELSTQVRAALAAPRETPPSTNGKHPEKTA